MLVRVRCKWRLQSSYSKYVPINKKTKNILKHAPVVLERTNYIYVEVIIGT